MKVTFILFSAIILSFLVDYVSANFIGSMIVQTNNYQQTTIKKAFQIKLALFSDQAIANLYINVSSADPLDGCLTYSPPQLQPPFLMLVDGRSGHCGYRQKAQSAKEVGAKGIIIIDDGAYIEQTIPYDKFQDGSFLIFLLNPNSAQGDYLQLLTKSKSFEVNIDVSRPKPTQQEKDKVEIWLSAIDSASYQTIEDWKETLERITILQKKIQWTINYAILGCNKNDPDCIAKFTSSCACQGLFCSPKYYGRAPGIVIAQDIRQKIIFQNHKNFYYGYMNQFKQKCLSLYQQKLLIDSCSYRIMQSLKLDSELVKNQTSDAIQKCQGKTFDQIMVDKNKYSHASSYPSILLNKQQIHYKNHRDLRHYLCQSLNLMEDPGCKRKHAGMILKSIVSVIVFVLILAGLVIIGMFLVKKYKQSVKRQMQKQLGMQISTAVSHYYQLSQSK